ncbi:uncharacterized protein LOC115883190 [Sitophilus oryzae]|uniref:Uncharacterized protein LOC115883190 n=1 Tax=Sitophilus oryzae TaxID=7048 RepID=A0A6J2Y0Y1_SITOR|nr:uncharacterized protein LOC115883190 [Sitophilus oryzae]
MGSHTSSHQRLKSISSRTFDFTEVVDFEFSDSGTASDDPKVINNFNLPQVNGTSVIGTLPIPVKVPEDKIKYPPSLILLIDHVEDIENKINAISDSDLFVHYPSLKDDLHNSWQKVYDIKETNTDVKQKKTDLIELIKSLLKIINERFLKRSCNANK